MLSLEIGQMGSTVFHLLRISAALGHLELHLGVAQTFLMASRVRAIQNASRSGLLPGMPGFRRPWATRRCMAWICALSASRLLKTSLIE